MGEQVRVHRSTEDSSDYQTTGRQADELAADDAVKQAKQASENGQKLTEEMDDLLDEIDGVLEENAAEFVRGYVQKGGE